MLNIQIITDEWIDIIYMNEFDNSITRKNNNDKGYGEIINNELKINWEKWGLEVFYKKNDIYYNFHNLPIDNYIFEIELDSNEWNDIGIIDINNNSIKRKYFPTEIGTFQFENNNLLIKWENWGLEKFYQLENGKIYSNTTFAKNITNNKKEIKVLAIVFPQFHEIPENNQFWGEGFTEWTLLKKIPRIVNNQIIKQPHNDIGYFNLKDFSHRNYMNTLANKFNIYGFCIYHYWFKDKKILYEPTELMLLDGQPNKPFLFCWANEQWTKRWDGGNNEILLKQDYNDINGNINHFNYLLQFFKHKNYIKKKNKPIFIFYRIEEEHIQEIKDIIYLWNNLAIKEGFNGIHFLKFLGPFNNNIILDEIDGYVEFEPGYSTQKYYNEIIVDDDNKIFNEYVEEIYLNKNSDIKKLVDEGVIKSGLDHYNNISDQERKVRTTKFFVYDGQKLYDKIIELPKDFKEQHRGISLNWNNTPRRNFTNTDYGKYPHYYKNINPKLFGDYFYELLNKIGKSPNNGDDFVFISAWNEWNEQAILEPNNEDGYDYLQNLNNNYLKFYNFPTKKNILNICHFGGGTEKYMNDLKKIFIDYNFINFVKFNFNIDYNNIYPNIDFIHINSILFNNLKDNYIYFLTNFFRGKIIYLTIHDYQWLFPDDPNIVKENLFINKNINTINFKLLLNLCHKIIFPSYNIYYNYNIFINLEEFKNKINIVAHPDKIVNNQFLFIPDIKKIINIGFIGYFINYKGSNLFKLIANNIKNYKDYIINYHVFGSVFNGDDDNDNSNIIFHGGYNDSEIIDIIHNENIHGLTHLSIFEESYCYALSNSINSGLPILYVNRGVLSERLNQNEKYFPCETNNLLENFILLLEFIIKNRNTNNFFKLNQNIQPNKWYIENYN